jgi:hypothetical protein
MVQIHLFEFEPFFVIGIAFYIVKFVVVRIENPTGNSLHC